jgi:hypothetical protein
MFPMIDSSRLLQHTNFADFVDSRVSSETAVIITSYVMACNLPCTHAHYTGSKKFGRCKNMSILTCITHLPLILLVNWWIICAFRLPVVSISPSKTG